VLDPRARLLNPRIDGGRRSGGAELSLRCRGKRGPIAFDLNPRNPLLLDILHGETQTATNPRHRYNREVFWTGGGVKMGGSGLQA